MSFTNSKDHLFDWIFFVRICLACSLSACSTIDQMPYLEQNLDNRLENIQARPKKPADNKSALGDLKTLTDEITPISHIKCSNDDEGNQDQLPYISLSFYDESVRNILAEISLLINFPVVIDEFVEGILSIEAENIRLDKAFDLISGSTNLSYRFFDDYILVGINSFDTPSWSSLSVNCRYWPRYISAEMLYSSIGDIERQFVFYPPGADYLTINAPPGIQKKIQKSLEVFDHSPGQVLLELSILEITRTDINRLGIEWSSNDLALAQGIISGDVDLIDQLQILAQSGQTQIKAMPSLLSAHGKKAKFSTTQESSQWQEDQTRNQQMLQNRYTSSQPVAGRESLEYGINMEIIPYIVDENTVTLKIIDASVSDLVVGGDGFMSVVKHKISNQVTVNNGEFILLGGMMQQSSMKYDKGLPKLRNLPILGRLFGQRKERLSDYEVLIMIRPSIAGKNH